MTNELIIDKDYCMSAFLQFRHIPKENTAWAKGVLPRFVRRDFSKADLICTSEDIDNSIKKQIEKIDFSKTGIMLSGGMDSAILATYLPKGAKAYTMHSIAKGAVNEVAQAKIYADLCGLNLKVVDITWEDFKKYSPVLMKNRKAPIHSIEPMIYKTLLQAKKDGCEYILCGENADGVFGGLDGLLSRDWLFEEFVERFNYSDPTKLLHNGIKIKTPYEPYKKDAHINMHDFISHFSAEEALNSYINAADVADIKIVAPFAHMQMGIHLDIQRIRSGESKYLIRELFKKRYNGLEPNPKLPMPRAVGVWLKDWQGPTRPEFKKIDINEFKPDQKWLMFILEDFLNRLDAGEFNE